MLASPQPLFKRWKVISGRVVPAQKVAGSMMAMAMPALERLKSAYPRSVRGRLRINHAIASKVWPYASSVTSANRPMAICSHASVRIGWTRRSMRHWMKRLPRAGPGAEEAPREEGAARGEAEDEGGEHQLEGVGGRAQNQREHADPGHLVDEGG